jgi:hypothetical protein
MAKHLYKKGNPGGPGRPKKPIDGKTLSRLSKVQVEQCFIKFMHMDLDALDAIVSDRSRSVLEHSVANIAKHAIEEGDQSRLNFLLDRIIGKVKDSIEHTVVKPTVIEKLNGDKVEMKMLGLEEDEEFPHY